MNEPVSDSTPRRSSRRNPSSSRNQRPTRHEVLAAFRRKELLLAARQVFAECGFERATMDRVAERAHVAKGTVYLYYASKRELYLAALTQGLTELHDLVRSRLDPASSCFENLRAFIETKMTFFDTERDFFRIYLELGLPPGYVPTADPALRRLYRAQQRILRDLLARAVARREIRELPLDRLAEAVAHLTRDAVARRLDGRIHASVSDDARFVIDLLWRGIASE
ncbi:MAG: TetR/AcrR family transcriptional regulator [Vicinamibacterales bacterium]